LSRRISNPKISKLFDLQFIDFLVEPLTLDSIEIIDLMIESYIYVHISFTSIPIAVICY
jgi:hypothetical protein